MAKAPKINPAAIDLLARVFNSHKKGLPEWLKNAREVYLRKGVPKAGRFVIINLQQGKSPENTWLECIDFGGISGADIEDRFLEWANPDAAGKGLKPGEAEGGQGNGGKAYLRQMFQKGYFVSICDDRLSVVSFVDPKKYVLDFIPDEKTGKDYPGKNPILPNIRKDASDWNEAYKLPDAHNITIVRGVAPTKPIDSDRLLEEIQQFPQARETIRTCRVHLYVNRSFKRELAVVEPQLHPAFPQPIIVPVPATLPYGKTKVPTSRPPDFPAGELELRISAKPLQGQALASWNRIDFHGTGVRVIGWRRAEELPLTFPHVSRHLFGRCTVPLLVDPKDNYEMQGRVHLNEGPLSEALYQFVAQEADKLLEKLAKQLAGTVAVKKRKNLEKLNERLARWIESQLSSLRGLSEGGEDLGTGKGHRRDRTKKVHQPPVKLAIHRSTLSICRGVSYDLRAIAEDGSGKPVPPGKLVWKSQNPTIVSVHPEIGTIQAKAPGLATVTVANDTGLTSLPVTIQVHEALSVEIRTASPVTVGSNRRALLVPEVKTAAGKTLKDVIVAWRSTDARVATVGQDGWLVGGEVGTTEVTAHVESLRSGPLEVLVEKGTAGKPRGGGKGRPQILLSGHDGCPFDKNPVLLEPTDPPIYQRPYKPDYDNNVFWINLQHPLADELLKRGEESVQWRTYHFQRLVDVYTILEMRAKFRGDENLDVDKVLDEIHVMMAELYAKAKEDLFATLYDDSIDFGDLDPK
jgi:hypothetical protein